MVTYQLFNKQINDLIQIEVVYENYPIIAGTDELSVLVRYRYTGEIPDPKIEDDDLGQPDSRPVKGTTEATNGSVEGGDENENKERTSSDFGGWGRRISSQLSSATRALFLQQLDTVGEEDEEDEEDLTKNDVVLYLGYSQVLGYYTVNQQIVDFSIFRDLQKSTIIGGKFAGIDFLPASEEEKEGKAGTSSQLANIYNTDVTKLGQNDPKGNMHMIPFYTTNQTILFGEMAFEPSKWAGGHELVTPEMTMKSFYVNIKLPKDLPPNFSSDAVEITYNLVLGYQDKNFKRETIVVPMKIQPYVDKFGRQPLFHLERTRLNQKPQVSSAVDLNSTDAGANSGRRMSFRGMRKEAEPGVAAANAKKVIRKSSAVSFDKIRQKTAKNGKDANDVSGDWSSQFMELASELDQADRNDVMKVQEKFEKEMNRTKVRRFNARENLIHIMADYKSVQHAADDDSLLGMDAEDEEIDYVPMIPRHQRTRYLIKHNHLSIATLALDKAVFKVGDLVNLALSFAHTELETKGLEIQLIRSQTFYRDEYLQKDEYDNVYKGLVAEKSLENVVYERVVSTFEGKGHATDLVIPLATEPQFKSNFFEVKYFVQVRFILLDQKGAYRALAEREKKIKEQEEAEAEAQASATPAAATPAAATATPPVDGTEADNEDGADGEEQTLIGEEARKKPLPKDAPLELQRELYDLTSIFVDGTGSILFKATDAFENAYDFTVRIPIVVLPNYEQDFGCVRNL